MPPSPSPIPLPATLMRRQLLIILTLLTIKSYGQCGREYPSGFYHNSKFVNTQGDTLNQLDGSGLYHGLHLYTDNPKNIYSDTNSFIIGNFEHGLPIGEWKDHCKDGSFSIGQFSVGGGQTSSDGKGGWINKKQGIYVKVGVWKYFDKDSSLIKTEKYDRQTYKNGWVNKSYRADSDGNFILTKYESKYNYSTKRRKETTKLFTDNGIPVSADYNSFWKNVSYEYNDTGQLSKFTKRKKFFGKYQKTTIEKEYNSKGQVKCKTKTKCKHPDTHIMINHAW
jgi:hypothetical protein